MTARLASAIAAASAKPAGVVMRRGVAVTAGSVELADGVVVTVSAWAGTPSPGQPCLLLAERGSLVGIPLGPDPGGGVGVTDHGELTGLLDDDHPQYVNTAGDVMTGPLGINLDGSGVRHNLHAASYLSTASTETGYLLITLGGATALQMMSQFVVSGYEYTPAGGQWRLDLGGYTYQASGWFNVSARAAGTFPGNQPRLPVRFLVKGGSGSREFALAIGDASTVWHYPQAVLEVLGGYSGADLAFASGYSMAITASLSGWTTNVTLTPTTPYMANAGQTRALSLATQSIPNTASTQLTAVSAQTGDTGSGATTLASGTLTILETGYWDISVYSNWASNTTGYRRMSIFVNDSEYFRDDRPALNTGGGAAATVAVNGLYLAAGTEVALKVYQNSGAALNFSNGRWLVRKAAAA